ncbi:MAG: alanyl-tRNA editing protein [Thermoplasmata archaeon]|nr:alanyl-tRNA editing protein [Thermoplasmata archaeon]
MTEAAYLYPIGAAYERSFRATVVARPPGATVLDRTYFYPVGGGQPSDQGWIVSDSGSRFPVTEVRKSGEAILHQIGRPRPSDARPLSVGDLVTGEVDWERRYRHMRLHTAQHFVSALLFRSTGRKTRSATMKGDRAVIDLDGPWPVEVAWRTFEEATLEALRSPHPVRIEQVPRAEWDQNPSERSGAVPLPPHVDPVRVLDIEGIDRCPCGGTHLRSTEEIGLLELDPPVAQGAGTRVGFRLRGASAHSGRVTP